MRIKLSEREGAPERLIADAELVFDEGDGQLAGLKLVGFSLWRGPDGDVYVTMPSRAFGGSSDRRYFDYLRLVDPMVSQPMKALKAAIVRAYVYSDGQTPGLVVDAEVPAPRRVCADCGRAAHEGECAAQRRANSRSNLGGCG